MKTRYQTAIHLLIILLIAAICMSAQSGYVFNGTTFSNNSVNSTSAIGSAVAHSHRHVCSWGFAWSEYGNHFSGNA